MVKLVDAGDLKSLAFGRAGSSPAPGTTSLNKLACQLIYFLRMVMSKSRKKWLCMDCSVDTGKIYEHYFVNLDLWMEATGSERGMLCIGCLESRIGRQLVHTDFPKVTINDPKHASMSQRLLSRLKQN